MPAAVRVTKSGATVASLGLVVSLGLAACSSSKGTATAPTTGTAETGATIPPLKVTGTLSGPGVTATTITIGQITTTTGPIPGLFQGANDGLDAWAAWMNANGGLAGHQIKISHVDDAFNCTTYTNAMEHFATSAFAVIGNLTLEDTCGKKVLAANPDLINIQALALDPTLYDVPNAFTASPTPPGGITTGLQYMKSKYPAAVVHAAEIVGQSSAAPGKEEKLTAESVGYKYLYVRDVPDLTTDFTSDILRMKRSGVQFIDMTDMPVTGIANMLQQSAQQNFHPVVVYGASGYDAQLFKLLGQASLANDVVWSALPDSMYLGQDRSTVPAVNTYLTWLQRIRPGNSSNLFAVDAWAAAQLLATAMSRAGSALTPSSVLQALRGVTDYNADGLIAPTNPGLKQGTRCVVMATVKNGQWTRAHPASGFDCSGTYHQVPLSAVTS